MGTRAHVAPGRARNTHVLPDGQPKVVFESVGHARAEADRIYTATGGFKKRWPYRCWMGPEHYHLSKSQPDLT